MNLIYLTAITSTITCLVVSYVFTESLYRSRKNAKEFRRMNKEMEEMSKDFIKKLNESFKPRTELKETVAEA